MAEEGNSKVRVLFIGGHGRNGSTLLERMLGQTDGFCSVGELMLIWRRSFALNTLCGCGKPFRQCEFWAAVIDDAYGGFDQVDVDAVRRLRGSIERVRYVPQALFAGPDSRYKQRFRTYSEILTKLYRSIQKVSGCRVIIDSSKFPSYGFVLNAVPAIDLSVLHLSRDSRAVAFSWTRRVQDPSFHWQNGNMPRFNPALTALLWNISNIGVESLKYFNKNYRFLRYEDFVKQPRATVSELLSWLGEGQCSLEFMSDDRAHLEVNHTVSGNPMRFRTGEITVRPDMEWKEKLRQPTRLVVTALTLPLLGRYGYLSSDD